MWQQWCALWLGLPQLERQQLGTTASPLMRIRCRSAWGNAALFGSLCAVAAYGGAPMAKAWSTGSSVQIAWGGLLGRAVLVWLTGHLIGLFLEGTIAHAYWTARSGLAEYRQRTKAEHQQAAAAAQTLSATLVPGRRPGHDLGGAERAQGSSLSGGPATTATTHENPESLAGRIIRTRRDMAPEPEEIRDALALLFATPYEQLYMAALSPQSGSSPEDLHAMGAAYVMARKRLEAREVREMLTPIASLPPYGSYFDHAMRTPRGVDLTRE